MLKGLLKSIKVNQKRKCSSSKYTKLSNLINGIKKKQFKIQAK